MKITTEICKDEISKLVAHYHLNLTDSSLWKRVKKYKNSADLVCRDFIYNKDENSIATVIEEADETLSVIIHHHKKLFTNDELLAAESISTQKNSSTANSPSLLNSLNKSSPLPSKTLYEIAKHFTKKSFSSVEQATADLAIDMLKNWYDDSNDQDVQKLCGLIQKSNGAVNQYLAIDVFNSDEDVEDAILLSVKEKNSQYIFDWHTSEMFETFSKKHYQKMNLDEMEENALMVMNKKSLPDALFYYVANGFTINKEGIDLLNAGKLTDLDNLAMISKYQALVIGSNLKNPPPPPSNKI